MFRGRAQGWCGTGMVGKMDAVFDVNRLRRLLEASVERWHGRFIVHDERDPFWRLVAQLQAHNFELWHEEDKARDPAASAQEIVGVKRNIDGFNKERTDTIEAVDELLLRQLAEGGVKPGADSPLHSETLGSIIDRLTILALRIYHMKEETLREDADEAHRQKCRERLKVLAEQERDLSDCLRALLEELCSGRKRFKIYRQMKMYNDPTLNPILYGRSSSGPKT